MGVLLFGEVKPASLQSLPAGYSYNTCHHVALGHHTKTMQQAAKLAEGGHCKSAVLLAAPSLEGCRHDKLVKIVNRLGALALPARRHIGLNATH